MRKKFLYTGLLFAVASILNFSCQKETKEPPLPSEEDATLAARGIGYGHSKLTKTVSSDVVVSWINMQLQMQKAPFAAGTAGQANDRCQAYCGIALYESVVQGMPEYQTLSGQLTDLPTMPSPERHKSYHWGASANAALAEMNRKLFPATADANKTAMTNLENSWQAIYANETDAETLQRSIAFGKEVATRVFNWAATDGSANVNPPYVPPVGPGLWVPTATTPPVGPYSYQRRKLVPGVARGTELAPPPAFSTDPGSSFYKMVKQVYDAGLALTADQKALADYFKDVPGYTPGGTYVALMGQVLEKTKPSLDKAALTYAKVGLAQFEATTVLFTDKYHVNLIRPVTYIRAYIDPNWSTYLPTPNHPEFPSGHSTTGGAVIGMLKEIFGDRFHITLHTYDYLSYPTRTYNSFTQLLGEISDSRLLGGLHYRATLDKSEVQGEKVAKNILRRIRFLKYDRDDHHHSHGHHHHGHH